MRERDRKRQSERDSERVEQDNVDDDDDDDGNGNTFGLILFCVQDHLFGLLLVFSFVVCSIFSLGVCVLFYYMAFSGCGAQFFSDNCFFLP